MTNLEQERLHLIDLAECFHFSIIKRNQMNFLATKLIVQINFKVKISFLCKREAAVNIDHQYFNINCNSLLKKK